MPFNMLFSWIGRSIFSKITPLSFTLLLSFFPIGTLFYLMMLHLDLLTLEEAFEKSFTRAKSAIEKKERALQFVECHSDIDPFFLDKKIESLDLLEEEKKKVLTLLEHPAIADKESLQRHLLFLEKNRFHFFEENLESYKNIKEVEEKQRVSVIVDENDLAKFCSLVEMVAVGDHLPLEKAPQLLFTHFHMEKVKGFFHNEHFQLQTQLLKREWLSTEKN